MAEILSSHGIVPVLALVAPSASDRSGARERFSDVGWDEVFLDAPHETLIERDTNGIYADLATQGGRELVDAAVFDVYEAPRCPDLRFDTSVVCVDDVVTEIRQAILAMPPGRRG